MLMSDRGNTLALGGEASAARNPIWESGRPSDHSSLLYFYTPTRLTSPAHFELPRGDRARAAGSQPASTSRPASASPKFRPSEPPPPSSGRPIFSKLEKRHKTTHTDSLDTRVRVLDVGAGN